MAPAISGPPSAADPSPAIFLVLLAGPLPLRRLHHYRIALAAAQILVMHPFRLNFATAAVPALIVSRNQAVHATGQIRQTQAYPVRRRTSRITVLKPKQRHRNESPWVRWRLWRFVIGPGPARPGGSVVVVGSGCDVVGVDVVCQSAIALSRAVLSGNGASAVRAVAVVGEASSSGSDVISPLRAPR